MASNQFVNLIAAQKAAVQAARAAGRLMHANWHRPKRIKLAEAHDIKLELDVRCQKLIEKILRTTYPKIPLLGEEGDTGDVQADYRWVVDPIDGTVNYFLGMPHAAVSIALQARSPKSQAQSHETVLGVICDPFTDELWTAIRGKPARLNGRRIHVSRHSRLEEAVIAMGFSKSSENLKKSLPLLLRLTRRARKIRIMGSAALELAYVASGRLDAYIERTINLWDIAAGGLLVECAGGKFWVKPIKPGKKLRLVASNGVIHNQLPVPE